MNLSLDRTTLKSVLSVACTEVVNLVYGPARFPLGAAARLWCA
ncbi:MAG TPA: hypothetical protein VGJ18_27175 [Gemmatimonadaceae bacterium]